MEEKVVIEQWFDNSNLKNSIINQACFSANIFNDKILLFILDCSLRPRLMLVLFVVAFATLHTRPMFLYLFHWFIFLQTLSSFRHSPTQFGPYFCVGFLFREFICLFEKKLVNSYPFSIHNSIVSFLFLKWLFPLSLSLSLPLFCYSLAGEYKIYIKNN